MKIVLYIIIIAIIALTAYALYVRLSDTDISGLSDSINSALDNASEWIQDKIDYVASYLTE